MLHTGASDSPSDVRNTGQCLGIFNFIENDKFGKFFSSKLNLSRQTFHAQGFGAQSFENDRQRYEWMLNLLNLICSLIGIFYGFFSHTFVLHSISLNNQSWTTGSPSRPVLTVLWCTV